MTHCLLVTWTLILLSLPASTTQLYRRRPSTRRSPEAAEISSYWSQACGLFLWPLSCSYHVKHQGPEGVRNPSLPAPRSCAEEQT
ncbi:hypothetical protein F5883DRAFT_552677 [Diaporthe sp. PMI_573]|nr:hypothetical protein F5883DRAFT_552677 [Diaporthaceae sp. PMI_573]